MKLSRRRFFQFCGASIAAGAGAFGYMRFFEPSAFEVTEKLIVTGKIPDGLRVLHLSDFHASPEVSYNMIEAAIDLSLGSEADIAFLTGDFITWHLENANNYSRILKKLSERIPTYACIGNHDGGSWAGLSHGYPDFSKISSLLNESGIRLLFNDSKKLLIKNVPVRVVGLGDLWSGDCKPEWVLSKERNDSDVLFVLSHNPDSKIELLPYEWDVLFCGHTHGGQLVVPFLGFRPFLPVRDKSFAEGLMSIGTKHIHITRGVGNLHGMRFNCKPEISLLNVT